MSNATALPNPVLPPERKCVLTEMFDPGFLELLRLVPGNPLVRALILKLTGKLPPVECLTFEQLQDWIEWHCEKRVRANTRRRSRPDDAGISVNVDFSETEYGRANYSVRRYGRESFHLNGDDLMEIIQDAIDDGGGLTEVVDAIADKIDDDAWNQCEPSLDEYGDYNYDEQDSTDSADGETSYSKNEIRTAVLAFVQERHPELAAEL
jgi:hypothetical protein